MGNEGNLVGIGGVCNAGGTQGSSGCSIHLNVIVDRIPQK